AGLVSAPADLGASCAPEGGGRSFSGVCDRADQRLLPRALVEQPDQDQPIGGTAPPEGPGHGGGGARGVGGGQVGRGGVGGCGGRVGREGVGGCIASGRSALGGGIDGLR